MTGEDLPRLAGLEGFELWDRYVRAPANKEVKVAFVSVRRGGYIGMNKAAYKMWGEPAGCQVMFDPERRRLGLRPIGTENRDGFDLNPRNPQICCKAMFDYYGVEITQTRRYHDMKVVDGVMIVDL